MRKTRSLGHRVLALFLCCVMVYGLIPTEAVALEPICGIEEHVHDESCHAVYGENVLKCRAGEYLHKHTDACYDFGGNLICHYADFYLHKHSAEQGCYDAGGNLTCTLPEYDESLHEDIYYSGGDVTCVYAPRFGHVHDDSCYEIRRTLTCGLEQDENAHRHDESCYDLVLTCGFDDGDASAGGFETESGTGTGGSGDAGIPGSSDGTSEGASEGAGDVAVPEGDVGSGEGEFPSQEGVQENPDGNAGGVSAELEGQDGDYAPLQHVHEASCYTRTLTCGLEETGHVHDDSCYETVRELTCGKIQDDGDVDGGSGNVCRHWQYELHTHDESCFDKDGNVICGKWELKSHTHDSHCFEREVLNYDSPEPTCGKDEHKHGISCYFKEKTEELEAFLDAYEAFMSGVESGEYDDMLSTDEGKLEVAAAAYEVKKLSTALDKDVLKLESVQEMLANLDKYIPEGYDGSGLGQDTLVGYVNPWTPPVAKFVSEDVSLSEMSGAKAVFDIELYQFDKSTYDSDAGKAFVTYDVWSASKIAEYNAKYKAAYAQPVTLGSDGGFAFPRLDCPDAGVYRYHVKVLSFTGVDGTVYVPDTREFRLIVEYRYMDSGYLGFIWWDIDTGVYESTRLGCAGTKSEPDKYPCPWGSEFHFDVARVSETVSVTPRVWVELPSGVGSMPVTFRFEPLCYEANSNTGEKWSYDAFFNAVKNSGGFSGYSSVTVSDYRLWPEWNDKSAYDGPAYECSKTVSTGWVELPAITVPYNSLTDGRDMSDQASLLDSVDSSSLALRAIPSGNYKIPSGVLEMHVSPDGDSAKATYYYHRVVLGYSYPEPPKSTDISVFKVEPIIKSWPDASDVWERAWCETSYQPAVWVNASGVPSGGFDVTVRLELVRTDYLPDNDKYMAGFNPTHYTRDPSNPAVYTAVTHIDSSGFLRLPVIDTVPNFRNLEFKLTLSAEGYESRFQDGREFHIYFGQNDYIGNTPAYVNVAAGKNVTNDSSAAWCHWFDMPLQFTRTDISRPISDFPMLNVWCVPGMEMPDEVAFTVALESSPDSCGVSYDHPWWGKWGDGIHATFSRSLTALSESEFGVGYDIELPSIVYYLSGRYVFRIKMTRAGSARLDERERWVVADVSKDGSVTYGYYDSEDQIPEQASGLLSGLMDLFSSGADNPSKDAAEFVVRPSVGQMPGFSREVVRQAEAVYRSLTPEERAGQLIVTHASTYGISGSGIGTGSVSVGTDATWAKLIDEYHVGGVMLMNEDTSKLNPTTLPGYISALQTRSKSNTSGIGLSISVDEEGGKRSSSANIAGASDGVHINRVSIFSQYNHKPFVSPKELLGDDHNLSNVYADGQEKAAFLKGFGFNVNFAPCADSIEPTNHTFYGRSASGDGRVSAEYVDSAVRGMGGIGTAVKHFPGYGDDAGDTHEGEVWTYTSRDDLDYNDLLPFYAGMLSGNTWTMVTHNTVPALDSGNSASCSPAVYKLIRDGMGFNGVCITDDIGMGAVATRYPDDSGAFNVVGAALRAIEAGADIALVANNAHDESDVIGRLHAGLVNRMEHGTQAIQDQLHDSVIRVLCWKIQNGLIDDVEIPDVPDGEAEYMAIGATSGQVMDFKSAMDQVVANGGTVKLLQDVTSEGNITIPVKQITLDLNGCQLRFLSGPGFVIDNVSPGDTWDTKTCTFDIRDDSYDHAAVLSKESVSSGLPNLSPSSSWQDAYGQLVEMGSSSWSASWYSVDDSGNPVKYRLNLGRLGAGGSVGRIVMSGSGDCPVIKYACERGGTVRFMGGAIRGTGMDAVVEVGRDVNEQADGLFAQFVLAGGWFFGCDADVVLKGHRYGSDIRVYGGGFVGNTCSNSVIGTSAYECTFRKTSKEPHVPVFGGNLTDNGVVYARYPDGASMEKAYGVSVMSFAGVDFGSNVSKSVHYGSCITAWPYVGNSDYFDAGAGNANAIFGYNFAAGSDSLGSGGFGALYLVADKRGGEDTWEFDRFVFGHNTSGAHGGGVFLRNLKSSVVFDGCTFVGNSSVNGGSISFGSDAWTWPVDVMVSNSTFASDYAEYAGGSIYGGDKNIGALTLHLKDVTFSNCRADGPRAGAITFAAENGRLFLDNVTVTGCTSGGSDSAISYFGAGASCTLSNRVYFDEASRAYTFKPGSTFFVTGLLDPSSRIPVQVDDSFFPDEDRSPVVLVTGSGSSDLASLVDCFVPNDGYRIYYNDGALWISRTDYVPPDLVVTGIRVEYYGEVSKANRLRTSTEQTRISLLDFSKAGSGDGNSAMRENDLSKFGLGTGMLPNGGMGEKNYPAYYVFMDGTLGSVPGSVRLQRVNVSVPIFRPAYFDFSDVDRISVDDRNKFSRGDSEYTLSEVWVGHEDIPGDGIDDRTNYDVIEYRPGLYFTIDADVAAQDENAILLRSEGQLVRYVAKPIESTKDLRAVFYDYDITDGKIYTSTALTPTSTISKADATARIASDKNARFFLQTHRSGINGGWREDETSPVFAFGNGNMNSGFSGVTVKKSSGKVENINQRANDGFSLTSFDMVLALVGGEIVWKYGIKTPDLFGLSDVSGKKTVFGNSSLRFVRDGNVFTLQNVVGPDGHPRFSDETDLRNFFGRMNWNNTRYICSNYFWPMDAAWTSSAEGHDPMFGGYKDGSESPYRVKLETTSNWGNAPQSDEYVDHNCYFGMSTALEFNLSDDYVGPLEFSFFGDDDFFVFLDGHLICDLGGVHNSVGAYVDLRDYLPVATDDEVIENGVKSEPHRLDIRYLERGASGSACWMQFQLPTPLRTVTDVPETEDTVGEVEITKSVSGVDSTDAVFDVEVAVDVPSGMTAKDEYQVEITDSEGVVTTGVLSVSASGLLGRVSKGVLEVRPGFRYVIKDLPVGTKVSVDEILDEMPNWKLDTTASVLSGMVGVERLELSLTNVWQVGELRITKKVVDGNNEIMACTEPFTFIGYFYENGDTSKPVSSLTGYLCPVDADPDASSVGQTVVIHHGEPFTVPANSTVYVRNLDKNIQYSIQELSGDAFDKGYALVGEPENAENMVRVGNVQEAVFVNALIQDMPELPSAGGIGLRGFMISGSALLCLVLLELRSRKRRTGTAG